MTSAEALESAIKRGGGIVAFARTLGVTHQAVTAWRKRGHVPFDRAARIEVLYGVLREGLLSPRNAEAYLTPVAGVDAFDVL